MFWNLSRQEKILENLAAGYLDQHSDQEFDTVAVVLWTHMKLKQV